MSSGAAPRADESWTGGTAARRVGGGFVEHRRRICRSSGQGGSHPLALTEPCVSLSTHTALVTQPKGFVLSTGSSHPWMVDRRLRPDDPSPWLHPHYQASQLLRDGPPLCPATGTQSLPDSADWDAPSRQPQPGRGSRRARPVACLFYGRQVPRFPYKSPSQAHATSMPDTAWPVHRIPPGSSQDASGTLVLMSSM